MSIMQKLFGSVMPTQQPIPNQMPQQQGVPSNNINTPPTQTTQQTPQTPANGVIPKQEPDPTPSPMDTFKDLWEPPKTDPNAPAPESNGFSPEKMMEAAAKVDFAKVISQEDLQKIAAGGQEAVTAFASALNKTAQQVFGQSTVVTQKLIERAQVDTRADVMKEVSGMIRKQTLNDSLSSENPAFQNPALQPVIQALQTQLTEKYPKASASELKKMTQEYLQGAAELIAPPKQKNTDSSGKPQGAPTEDWDKYFAS